MPFRILYRNACGLHTSGHFLSLADTTPTKGVRALPEKDTTESPWPLLPQGALLAAG
jgi:hypothetical protein